jgi:hypothetical protein
VFDIGIEGGVAEQLQQQRRQAGRQAACAIVGVVDIIIIINPCKPWEWLI